MEVEGLLAWINTFNAVGSGVVNGSSDVKTLEQFILGGIYWRVLVIIGPSYASIDMVVPEPPHSAEIVKKLGYTFCSAVRRFDEMELHLPSFDLLNIDFGVLSAWVASGEPFLTTTARYHAEKCLKVCLACGVKCNDKAKFIPNMTSLPAWVQGSLMRCIQTELLKEPVPSVSDEVQLLRTRLQNLEREREDANLLRERNEQLVLHVQTLEMQMQKKMSEAEMNGAAALAAAPAQREDDGAHVQIINTLREQLHTMQEELVKREKEARTAIAQAAEATARARDARQLRDDLDLANETIGHLREELGVAKSSAQGGQDASTREVHSLREEVQTLRIENAAMRERELAAKREMSRVQGDLTRVRTELEQSQAQLKSRVEEARQLHERWVESRALIGTLEAEVGALSQRLKQSEVVRGATLRSTQEAAPIASAASLFDELDESSRSSVDSVAAIVKERDALKARLERLEADFEAEALAEREQAKALIQQNATALAKATHELKDLRDRHSQEMEALKASSTTASLSSLQLSQMQAQLDNAIKERDKLKELLKVAREKLMAPSAAATPVVVAGASSAEALSLEQRVLATHVHRQGLEVMRLAHQVDVLRRERSNATTAGSSKHNGLLNHLRFAVDQYQLV